MPKKRHPTGGELDDSDAYLSALGNEIDFVGDTLGATQWRQDIDSAPLAQIAEQALRGEQPPTAGGTSAMATDAEVAATLNGILDQLPDSTLVDLQGSAEDVQGRLQQCMEEISRFMTAVANTLSQSSGATEINMSASTASIKCEQAAQLAGQMIGLIGEALGSISAAQTAGQDEVARRSGG